MTKIIPQSFYDNLLKDLGNSKFEFTARALDTPQYRNTDLQLLFSTYYPCYLGKGMYKPFIEIPELREFGEQIIELQNSPLWKALK